jgi:methylthioribulose-1-phosphate dehydratase
MLTPEECSSRPPFTRSHRAYSPMPQAPTAQPTPQPVGTQALSDLKASLCKAMTRIHQRGWCDGTGGNFSCVAGRDPLLLLMAPSGVDKGSVVEEALILVDGQGGVLQGEGQASAETQLHLEIVRCTGAGAVLHTHSQAATLLSTLHDPARTDPADADAARVQGVAHLVHRDLEMLKGLAGVTTHDCLVKVPVLSNDQDLKRLSQQASPHLKEAPHAILIAGHGLYAWGLDLSEAMRHLEIHEFLLEQHWRRLLLQACQPPQPVGASAGMQL